MSVVRRRLPYVLTPLGLLLLISVPAAVGGPPAGAADAPGSAAVRFYAQRGLLLLLVGGALTGILLARRGRALPIRDISGLLAFEEAVSRATEMGRPALFTAGGASEIRRVQTFAAMPLLRHVAKLSGELGNELIMPVCFPETLPLHANAARDGFMDAGTPEHYHAERVRFFPGGQFFFAIASMGWMLEERPAACFYFGWWEADSLMFAETGQTIQAMQIAGTDQLAQVPFFVASCDYTLIGEEFWAASAKISRDPQLLGSMGAQDLFKLALLVLIVGGTLLCLHPSFAAWMSSVRELFVRAGADGA